MFPPTTHSVTSMTMHGFQLPPNFFFFFYFLHSNPLGFVSQETAHTILLFLDIVPPPFFWDRRFLSYFFFVLGGVSPLFFLFPVLLSFFLPGCF